MTGSEGLFRLLAGLLVFSGLGMSAYFRSRANRRRGPLAGNPRLLLLRCLGLAILLPMIGYLIRPEWVVWAHFDVPNVVRWFSLGVSLVCLVAVASVLRHLGENISAVEFTRATHELVVGGPYRWIRHPLYTFGGLFWTALGLATALWPVTAGFLVMPLLLASRVPLEEAELERRFGEPYRRYQRRTGRFFPRLGAFRGRGPRAT